MSKLSEIRLVGPLYACIPTIPYALFLRQFLTSAALISPQVPFAIAYGYQYTVFVTQAEVMQPVGYIDAAMVRIIFMLSHLLVLCYVPHVT